MLISTSQRNCWQINSLSEKHVPLKQITKTEGKTKSRPWIRTGILRSIQNKNKIFSKFCKVKDQEQKDLQQQQFKNYRNILSNLTKKRRTIMNNILKKIKTIKIWQRMKDKFS